MRYVIMIVAASAFIGIVDKNPMNSRFQTPISGELQWLSPVLNNGLWSFK